MKNRQIIESELNKFGYTIGCYNSSIDSLNKINLKKVLDALEYGDSTRCDVFINRKKHIIEIDFVDSEVDFELLTVDEFNARNGY